LLSLHCMLKRLFKGVEFTNVNYYSHQRDNLLGLVEDTTILLLYSETSSSSSVGCSSPCSCCIMFFSTKLPGPNGDFMN